MCRLSRKGEWSVLGNADDLKKYKIGVLKGTLMDDSLLSRAGIRYEQSSTQESLLAKLKLGRIDLYFELDLVGQRTINSVYPGEEGDFGSIALAGTVAPIAIMIARGHPGGEAAGARYRLGLKRIIENGTYRKILAGYYGKDGIPEDWQQELAQFQRLYTFEAEE